MAERNEKIDQVFAAALEIAEPAPRLAYLQQACGGGDELCHEGETLLAAHQQAGTFLEEPSPGAPFVVALSGAHEAQSAEAGAPNVEKPGDRIGRFKLLEQIGEGGFGTVWMAEQEEPVRRRVALKVIKLGMDTKQVIARFEAERQALAMMDHQNIARVFDGGATETGRPYFVMELVRGVPITDYCNQNRFSTQQRLELFASVCSAVQAAAQKGIIHPDIKPANVLVS